MHLFLSGSRAQEKEEVTRGSFKEPSGGGLAGGRQVAFVKKSTSLRMKKRGNVPPRLETLIFSC